MSPFHPLHTDVPRPLRFTFPFCYEPHELSRMAAREVRLYVESVDAWTEELARGKMFGVLVVETERGELGYLAAFSGLLAGGNDHPFFVPPVFDATAPDGHFKQTERQISAINDEIRQVEASEEYALARLKAEDAAAEAAREEADYREVMRQSKLRRDAVRQSAQAVSADYEARMIRESQHQKAELRRLKQRNAVLTAHAAAPLRAIEDRINHLKAVRKQMSDDLQQWLFTRYNMLNARGESCPLTAIFAATPAKTPPAGAGDCCAPKLLQYAYGHGLHPVCMAEFWYGASPRGEVRHHLHYYPACRGKCLPILSWMMQGLDVEADPQLRGCTQPLEIVYEDSSIIVVNKPAGMLTVPGRSDRESVLSLLREHSPGISGPVMVHRLDMDTSGLIVAAKTAETYRELQQQFLLRTVRKHYTALIDGTPPAEDSGEINLPLYSDPFDRPYQKVDFHRGKPSRTLFRVLRRTASGTVVDLVPLTGRTHQLRVHCASPLGLNAPIRGDRLYGHPDRRLFLHAARLTFTHPATGRTMTFERKADFDILL